MARTNFENLRVYQLSEELADEIWDIVIGWNNFAKDTVGKQIVRSVDSIGANIAEGEGRGSFQDNRRFCKIARGSLQETQHWLRRAFKRNLLTEEQIKKLKPMIQKLSPTLNAYLSSIGTTNDSKDKGQRTKD
jgi:four helix bundle protein